MLMVTGIGMYIRAAHDLVWFEAHGNTPDASRIERECT